MTVDELLAQARAILPHRPTPAEAFSAQARGALLVDIRGDDQLDHLVAAIREHAKGSHDHEVTREHVLAELGVQAP